MKRFLMLITAAIIMISTIGCSIESRQEQVRSSLSSCEPIAFYTSGGFQDYTDFGMYTCSTTDLESNPYFTPVTSSDQEVLRVFWDDFEDWIEIIRSSDPQNEVVVHYAFDRSIADTGDFFYIYEDPDYHKFGNYDIWFLDSQTNVLYYFHNNI